MLIRSISVNPGHQSISSKEEDARRTLSSCSRPSDSVCAASSWFCLFGYHAPLNYRFGLGKTNPLGRVFFTGGTGFLGLAWPGFGMEGLNAAPDALDASASSISS